MGTHGHGPDPDGNERLDGFVPIDADWVAVGDCGGWRGLASDGRRTHQHLNVEAVMKAIEHGWLEGVVSVIAPELEQRERIKV